MGVKTDLEKFKELFDSIGLEYEFYPYSETTNNKDICEIIISCNFCNASFLFETNEEYKDVIIYPSNMDLTE